MRKARYVVQVDEPISPEKAKEIGAFVAEWQAHPERPLVLANGARLVDMDAPRKTIRPSNDNYGSGSVVEYLVLWAGAVLTFILGLMVGANL